MSEVEQLRAALERERRARARLEAMIEERTRALFEQNEELERVRHGLEKANADLARSNRELEAFASAASHDLQEPLRKIIAFGERLSARHGSSLPPDGRDWLERMMGAAVRMRTLIDDLLQFCRVTTQARPAVRVELSAVVRDVVSDLEVRIEQVGGQV